MPEIMTLAANFSIFLSFAFGFLGSVSAVAEVLILTFLFYSRNLEILQDSSCLFASKTHEILLHEKVQPLADERCKSLCNFLSGSF